MALTQTQLNALATAYDAMRKLERIIEALQSGQYLDASTGNVITLTDTQVTNALSNFKNKVAALNIQVQAL